ncbi:TonB-linked outer membrane protein, SusC/RagA family [Chitinophaga sp. YR573]|uniref:SusC/RagA family TonB-linked outer membrane protein n=1 Tax=Chitinophaga sp. YR573 TaxID=1881040 RepID=UPI0008B899B0|nr:SusC/RagA family TonB-linked outer membrane protein [Chitinophaga sp. YR573]SEW04044.1 TonB-linked outer membrane protein, SusC/RagA family [Chitinophaga sp. YR573]
MQIPTPRGSLLARFLTLVLMLHSFLCLPVLASQTGKQKITIVANDITLDNVFKQIEKQTGLRFMFAVDALNVSEKVTVSFQKTILDEVLSALLSSRGIIWQYREGTISLKHQTVIAKPMSIGGERTPAIEPPFTITGKVLDAQGNPVPGATVAVKGAKKGTKTDGDGSFVLAGVDANAVLLVSSIGFETKEVNVANVRNVIIRMNEVVNRLDETVIIGYGTTTQRFNTGNVTSVKAEDITKQPITDPLLALQGRVPGMIITQTTGIQGGVVKVQIRGQNSINSGTQPLFIVDGIPYTQSITGMSNFGAIGGSISALSFVNPADIESIDVLKDADATAIYGSRGSNGVILITTKKGKMGAAKVDINVYSGWANVTRKRKLLNTSQYLEMRREAFKNDGVTPNTFNAPDLLIWDTTRYTDWQRTIIGGTARYTDAQASVSGGNVALQYLMGGNYHKQTSVFPGNFSSENGGGHFSIMGNSPDQKLKTVLTGSYATSKANFPGGAYADYIDLPPNAPPIYNNNGSLNWANSTWDNPYAALLLRNILDIQTDNLLSSVDVSYRLLPGLVFKANLGYNELSVNSFKQSPIASIDPKYLSFIKASATYFNNKRRSWSFEPQITYITTIWKGAFNAMAGATILSNKEDADRLTTGGIKDDALIRNPASATTFSAAATGSRYKYAAVFGRVGYNLEDKYILNLTIRRDGSSRFGPRKQFATFGAIGVGWLFSQEDFIKIALPWLSYGKLRASYGTTGNDQIGDYQYLDNYQYEEQPYQGVKGLRVNGLYNADFAWELTRKAEVGLETGFFKDRILLTTSYYRNHSTNQLIGYPQPSMVGAEFITGNLPAVIQNAGWEFVLTTKNKQSRYFEWSTTFNISFVRNKLVSYSGNGQIYARVGRALSEKRTYKVLGVDPATGSYQFANAEGKPVSYDQSVSDYLSVNPVPVYFGGFQNSFRYKGFNLDVFFQYVKQQGANGLFSSSWVPGSLRNQPVNVLTRWKQVGDNADVQRFSQDGSLRDAYLASLYSNRGYADASFIRFKNLALSWQLPDSWKQKMRINNCRVYIQGQNLLTITHYPGWDPETQSVNVIPPLRVMTAGFQLTL